MTTRTRRMLVVAAPLLLASCSPTLQQYETPEPTRLPAWDRLQSDHGAAAVILTNEHRIEIVWNSGDHALESTYTNHVAVAILDTARAREWRSLTLDEPAQPGTKLEELRVTVTRSDRSVQELTAEDITVERIGKRPIRHHVTIPDFENHIVIDFWWRIFGGSRSIPCTEIPVSLSAPCERTSLAVRFPKINPTITTDLEKQRFLKDWRVVVPRGAEISEVTYGDVIEKTWVWDDVPARAADPTDPGQDLILVGQDTRRLDSSTVFGQAYDSRFVPRRKLTDLAETDLNPDSLSRLPAADRVAAVQKWLRANVRTVSGRVCVTSTPEAPTRTVSWGMGTGLDVACLGAGLLHDLDVQTQLVGVREPTPDLLDTPVVCPYFPYVVLYVPALDPERELSNGFVDITGFGATVGVTAPADSLAAVFLDGSRRYPVLIPPPLWNPESDPAE